MFSRSQVKAAAPRNEEFIPEAEGPDGRWPVSAANKNVAGGGRKRERERGGGEVAVGLLLELNLRAADEETSLLPLKETNKSALKPAAAGELT